MSRYGKEPRVADVTFAALARLPGPKNVSLHIATRLKHHAHRIQHNTRNVPSRAKGPLRVARHVGRVEERDGQRDDPDPEHLKDPEAEKGEELTAHLIEAVILARPENAEEEES